MKPVGEVPEIVFFYQRVDFFIYKITNPLNGKMYVGRTRNPFRRMKGHESALNRNQHHSKALQKDFNETHPDLTFEVIEKTKDRSREKFWIKELKTYESEFGYNDNDKYVSSIKRETKCQEY